MTRERADRPHKGWRVWLKKKPRVGDVIRYGNTFVTVMVHVWWRKSSTGQETTIIIWRHSDGRIGTSGRRAHSINWSWSRERGELSDAELITRIEAQINDWAQKREDDW